jgi:hypothetical protein
MLVDRKRTVTFCGDGSRADPHSVPALRAAPSSSTNLWTSEHALRWILLLVLQTSLPGKSPSLLNIVLVFLGDAPEVRLSSAA